MASFHDMIQAALDRDVDAETAPFLARRASPTGTSGPYKFQFSPREGSENDLNLDVVYVQTQATITDEDECATDWEPI